MKILSDGYGKGRTHKCGNPMEESLLNSNLFGRQPIWACTVCYRWEPRDGWEGALPDWYSIEEDLLQPEIDRDNNEGNRMGLYPGDEW